MNDKNPLTAIDLFKEKMKEAGYDGLFNERSDCCCDLSDIAPCLDSFAFCQLGYRVDGCSYCKGVCDCNGISGFYVVENNPSTTLIERNDRLDESILLDEDEAIDSE